MSVNNHRSGAALLGRLIRAAGKRHLYFNYAKRLEGSLHDLRKERRKHPGITHKRLDADISACEQCLAYERERVAQSSQRLNELRRKLLAVIEHAEAAFQAGVAAATLPK